MSHHSTRINAIANQEGPSATIPESAKRKCTTEDTASEAKKKALENLEAPPGDDSADAIQGPPKPRRGHPPAKTKVPENLEDLLATIPASSKKIKWKCTANDTESETDDTPEADEFEQMQIETLAEMELQEELDEEAAERSVVRKQAEASSLDDAEDVKEGGEDKGTSTNKANSELPDDETEAEGKVEPKGKQQKKKAARGETQAAVDKVKVSLKAAGKKKAVKLQTTGQNKTKASFPSGLVSNWQLKLSVPSQTSWKMKAKVSEPTGIALGGLDDDDDAFATFSPLVLKGTGRNHKNESAWCTSFLPTLYNCLEHSSDPFVINPDMVKEIQEKVDMVYLDNDHEVTDIYLGKGSTQRKRSFFGLKAIKIVAEFFRDKAYANRPNEIAKYALWAMRGDGPAIYGILAPIECTDNTAANYVKPANIFESKFVMELLTQYLKWCKGLCYEDGQPYGVISIAAAAVKCAFLMYTTGLQVDWGLFSKDIVGAIIGEYIYVTEQLSDRR
ncbi:hypothetical protein BC827DRAFT_1270683 [Russula dissimulans]|nr:hypothetical protein BC827DRAFT_1270683 [Russula dissimulans]